MNSYQWLILLAQSLVVNNNLYHTKEFLLRVVVLLSRENSLYPFFSQAHVLMRDTWYKKYDSVDRIFYNFIFFMYSYELVLFVILFSLLFRDVGLMSQMRNIFERCFPLCIDSTEHCEGNSTSPLVKLPRQLLFLYKTRSCCFYRWVQFSIT